MFGCFFPSPRLFAITGAGWTFVVYLFWQLVAFDMASVLGIGEVAGASGDTVWLYIYALSCTAVFVFAWMWGRPHRWALWSVAGSSLILLVSWFQVQMDLLLNDWFRVFYNTVQTALGSPGAVSLSEYFSHLVTFATIAMVIIFTSVVIAFFTSHYVFRWRTAMNDRYVAMWQQVRHIEGASQRIQEDTMRFAAIMEALGSRFIDAMLTLIAFLPVLWALSEPIKEIPVVGEIAQALVWVAIVWSVFGTGLLALAGYRLPGLEFRNQRVEAAFRKELVMGEDADERAHPPTLDELFANVRRNYFRIYFNYLYFNIARYTYLQVSVLVPYIALGPTIVAAGFTLGAMQQIIRAFERVQSSFQFLVMSWTTIVELISIYKRLAAFERAIRGDDLAAIEFETGGLTATGN